MERSRETQTYTYYQECRRVLIPVDISAYAYSTYGGGQHVTRWNTSSDPVTYGECEYSECKEMTGIVYGKGEWG